MSNQELNVDDTMVWIVNFPSFYTDKLFNFEPYCLIDNAPLNCYNDLNIQYQLIITGSPKIIQAGTNYTLTIIGLACPRHAYTHDLFLNRYLFIGML